MVATAFARFADDAGAGPGARPGCSPRSTTRSAPPCWWTPRATSRAGPSASTACSAIWASQLAPVVTAFLAHQAGWRAAFLVPGVACAVLGLVWMRVPSPEAAIASLGPAVPGDPAPPGAPRGGGAAADRHRLRAGVQRLHPAAAEADAGAAGRRSAHAAAGRGCGVPRDAVRRADPVHRRPDDRPHDAEARVPADQRAAGAGAGRRCPTRKAGWCCRWPRWWRRRSSAR